MSGSHMVDTEKRGAPRGECVRSWCDFVQKQVCLSLSIVGSRRKKLAIMTAAAKFN